MAAQKAKKPEKSSPDTGDDPKKAESTLGFAGFLGIVLLAGALFNVPAILKVPVTTEEKMMLVIVLSMAVGGIILIIFGKKKS